MTDLYECVCVRHGAMPLLVTSAGVSACLYRCKLVSEPIPMPVSCGAADLTIQGALLDQLALACGSEKATEQSTQNRSWSTRITPYWA